MIKIRRNIFETNSSSTHKIVLTNEHTKDASLEFILKQIDLDCDNKDIDFYKELILEEGYGWENFVLTSELDKLDYVISQILDTDWFKHSGNSNDENRNQSQKFIWNLFRGRLFEKLGYNIMVPIDYNYDNREIHYVDHQSTISDNEYIKHNKDIIIILNNLWDIVFNPKIIIVGGNDNEDRQIQLDIIIDHKGEILKNPFTRTKGIDNIFGKYMHTITNYNKSLNKGIKE